MQAHSHLGFIRRELLCDLFGPFKSPKCGYTTRYYRPQRSCEGYVFTRVCPKGRVLSQQALQVVSQHALQQGGSAVGGGACSGGGRWGACSVGSALGGGGACSGGALRPPPKADGYCCGRYASYWNELLLNFSVNTKFIK